MTDEKEIEVLPGVGSHYYLSTADPETGKKIDREVSSQEFWAVVERKIQAAIDEGGTKEEITNRLQSRFGNDPQILNLIMDNNNDWIRKYWPDAYDTLINYEPADLPTPTQPKRIDVNGSQGTGSLPPSSSAERKEDSGAQGTNSSPKNNSKTGGDPLILFSGQFYHQVTDLEVKGRGLNFAFVRTYLNQTHYKGPLGYSWDHSYNLWLREETEIIEGGIKQNVIYRSNGSLREDKYVQMLETADIETPPLNSFRDAVFRAPLGFFDQLEKYDDIYTLETVTGTKFEYNSDLYINRIIDPNGNEIVFRYDTNKLLTEIIDPVGKKFLLEYDEMNRIKMLEDKTGKRKIRYYYGDNGDLEEVDLYFEPDLIAGTDYRYAGPDFPYELQHGLIEIINPMGYSILENEYGIYPGVSDYARVIRQRSSDGEYRYEYNRVNDSDVDPLIDPINVAETSTTVIYPNNHYVEHWFNSQGNVVKRAEQIIGLSSTIVELISRFRYNIDGLLLQEIRPNGSSIEYFYQRENYAKSHGDDTSSATPTDRLAFGNLLRIIDRPKNDSDELRVIVIDYTYYADKNRLKSQKGLYYADKFLNVLIDQKITEITYTYDSSGNLINIIYPNVILPDNTNLPIYNHEFQYNTYGLITDVIIGPVHTKHIYFLDEIRSGFVKETIEDVLKTGRHSYYDVDNLGRIKQITGYFGGVTNIEWTTFDTPKLVQFPEVSPGTSRPNISYSYNLNRQLCRSEEELRLYNGELHPEKSLVTTYKYDEYGRLIKYGLGSSSVPNSKTKKTLYTPFNLIFKEVDYRDNVTLFEYDERMLLSSITRGWGSSEKTIQKLIYDKSGNVIESIDGRGFKVTIEHDGFGRPHTRRDPDGNELETTFDASGRIILYRLYGFHPLSGIKVRWKEMEFHYDAAGRLFQRTEHLFIPGTYGSDELLSTQFFYNSLNRLEYVIDANRTKWYYVYDNLGRLIFSQDMDNNKIEWDYDDSNRTITRIEIDAGKDKSGKSISQVFKYKTRFDIRGLPIEDTDGLGNIVNRGFDSRRLLSHYLDSSNHELFTEYDIFGQPNIYKIQLEDHQVQRHLTYDANGNIKNTITPTGGTTIRTYDSLNRLASIERNGNTSTYTYDSSSNIILERNENGIQLIRSYTPANFLQSIKADISNFSAPEGDPFYVPTFTSDEEFKYTPAGNVAIAKNGVADVIISYDSADRVIKEQTNEMHVNYRYDNVGKRTGLIFPDGRDILFEYSHIGCLEYIRQSITGSQYPGDVSKPSIRNLVSFRHIGRRPSIMEFGPSHIVNVSYDGGKRVTGINWTRLSDGATILKERDLYGPKGELKVNQVDDLLRIIDYDKAIRLVKTSDYIGVDTIDIDAFTPPISKEGLAKMAIQKDIDSLISKIKTTTRSLIPDRSFSFELDDNTNRLKTEEYYKSLSERHISTLFVPDPNDQYQSVGGITFIYDKMGNVLNDGINKYRYDAFNRLTEIENPKGLMRILSDSFNRQISIDSPFDIKFIYAGQRLIEWRINKVIQGQVVPVDHPYQYAHLATDGYDCAPVFDIMNSILGWIKTDETVIGRTYYDSFGQILKQDKDSPAPFGFAGYWYERHSGLYNLPARKYNPRIGRFLQEDPLGLQGGWNLYAYANHSPGTLTDYYGLSPADIDWSTVVSEGAKTLATGAAIIGGGAALVGAGIVSAPFVAGFGIAVGLIGGIMSYAKREDEAIAAGKTDYQGKAARAALFDIVGATKLYEGVTGKDSVTDLKLTSEDRSSRLGTGAASIALLVAGPKIAKLGIKGGQQLSRPVIRTGNQSELYTEQIMDAIKMQEGKSPLPSQFKNNNGLDRVYTNSKFPPEVDVYEFKFKEKVFDPAEIHEVLANLVETERYGLQGSEQYVISQAQRLLDSGVSTTAMKQTGATIALSSELNRYLVLTDPHGQIFSYHLNFWEMVNW